MIRSTWLLIASFLFSLSRLWKCQPCWVAVQHLTRTTSDWEGERSDLKLILLAIVKQCCSSRWVYFPQATMRCLDAKMCRLIAGGTMVTSKEGVVHPTFWGGHPFVRWPWVGGKASPFGRVWSKRLEGITLTVHPPWRRMFLTQNVMFDSCLLAFDESATGGVQLHRDLRHGEEFFTTSTTTRATATLFISSLKDWRWSENSV